MSDQLLHIYKDEDLLGFSDGCKPFLDCKRNNFQLEVLVRFSFQQLKWFNVEVAKTDLKSREV